MFNAEGPAREVLKEGLVRVKEAAQLLGVSRSQVYKLMDGGELPFVRLRKSRRIPRTGLVQLISRNMVPGPVTPEKDKTQN